MPRISTLQVALGVGAAGAMVDVSAQVRFVEGIQTQSGKANEFRDTDPGTGNFTLENYDGRYTPGNLASSLATLLDIGTSVSVNVGGALTAGTVQGIAFMPGNTDWGLVQITFDDMLGNAARKSITNLGNDLVAASGPYLYWRLIDAAAVSPVIDSVAGAPLQIPPSTAVTLGTAGFPQNGGDSVASLGGYIADRTTLRLDAFPVAYSGNSLGYWGFWAQPLGSNTPVFLFGPTGLSTSGYADFSQFQISFGSAGQAILTNSLSASVVGPSLGLVPQYVAAGVVTAFAAGVWTTTATLWVNGVSYGSIPHPVTPSTFSTFARYPTAGFYGNGATSNLLVSHLSHTATLAHEEGNATTTEASRLAMITAVLPELSISAASDLSTAPVSPQPSGGSALDALNSVVRTEQGYMDTVTTGSLLAPVQTIRIRARNRPTAVTYSFDAQTELSDPLQFIYDLTNMISSETVTSSIGTSVLVPDPTVIGRVGSANSSDAILFATPADMQYWGQDRIARGKNPNMRIVPLQVDALVTPTDRSLDLLAARPGDRIRITNIPANQFGITTWDGYLIGRDQTHSLTQHLFTLNLAPALGQAVWGTDRYMAGGALTLAAAITNASTTIQVATTGARMTTTDVPFQIIIDREVMTVNTVSAGTPQVLGVTRAQGVAPAAAHSSAANVEIYPDSLYAY
jgi:hypothetical protein